MSSAFVAARAMIFAAAFMGGWFWVILRLQPLSREWDAALPLWTTAPGLLLALVGSIGIVVCVALFVVRGRGTPAIFDAPRKFVAVGPYRLARNPMYLSAFATFGGYGLYVRSLAVLAFAAAWFLLAHFFVLFVEEPGLRRRFGSTYDQYCARVPRWMPRTAAALLAAAFIVAPTHGQAARPDLTGTWTLSVGRSDYGPFLPPIRRTDVIEHRDATLKVARREVMSTGDHRAGEWACSTDGIECTNTIGGTEMKSTAHWEETTLVVETKTTYRGQEASLEDRWTLSPDRHTLTIHRSATSPQGTAEQTFVLER
jgi:protein-S-isoprenylcysteine O-methyltransferase Ste14